MNTVDAGNSRPHKDLRGAAPGVDARPRWSRKALKWAGVGALVLFIAASTATALVVHQVSVVRGHLEGALSLVSDIRAQLAEGDHQAAQATLLRVEERTSAARSTTTSPLWRLASNVPIVGGNFEALGEVAVSAEDITTGAAAPLLSQYEALNIRTISPVDGRVEVDQLQKAAPSILAAATTAQHSYERMASIDLSRLLPGLANPIRSATEQLKGASSALATASSAVQLLPSMLGAEGPRTYLVLLQNSAEARATGGIPGALATLRVDDGEITLGEQSSAGALGPFVPSLAVDPEQTALYTARLGTHMQNVNLTPDFPTSAQTAKAMWEKRHINQTIDGVLAVDPLVLSYLLEATGPVALTDAQILQDIGTTSLPSALTMNNVVSTLLSDVYREIDDPAAQDAYFASVAAQVFSAFSSGQGDGTRLFRALTLSTQENRIYLWSSHPDEQSILMSTPLNGSVNGRASGGAAFGVYFNDGTGAKMDYYVKRSVQLIQTCHEGEYGQYTIRVTAANGAPADAGSSLPAYVTGNGVFGVEPGRVRTNYVMYGPAQSLVESARVNGETVPVGSGKHGQRPVGTVTQELAPGETAVIEVDFTRVVQDSEPRLHVTPTVQPVKDVILPVIREDGCS